MTIHYVDFTGGLDANDGLSTGAAWKTISKVNGSTFSAGDQVLFKKGETWREGLVAPSSGSSGNPMIFGAYGSGADPLIKGSDILVKTWTSIGSNRWTASQTPTPTVLFFDGTRGTLVGSQAAVVSAGQWFWAANVLTVFSTSDPATAFTSPGIETVLRTGIDINAKSWVKLQGLATTQCTGGILIHGGGDDNTVDTCSASWCTSNGMFVTDNGTDRASFINCTSHDCLNGYALLFEVSAGSIIDGPLVSGGTFYNCPATFSGGVGFSRVSNGRVTGVECYGNWYGIKYVNKAVNCRMDHNVVHNNSNFGLDLDVGGGGADIITGCIVEYNNVYSNGSYGIAIEQDTGGATATTDNITRYNIVHSNSVCLICNQSDLDHIYYNIFYSSGSFDMLGATNQEIYNNVFYATEITHWTGSNNCVIKNNIFYQTQGDYFIEQAFGVTNLVCDYNSYYKGTAPLGNFRLNGTGLGFSGWQAAGQDAHSTWGTDPKMVNPTGADFTLQSDSPCINAGTNVGLTQDYLGHLISGNPDIGAYEYGTSGPITAPSGLRIFFI